MCVAILAIIIIARIYGEVFEKCYDESCKVVKTIKDMLELMKKNIADFSFLLDVSYLFIGNLTDWILPCPIIIILIYLKINLTKQISLKYKKNTLKH